MKTYYLAIVLLSISISGFAQRLNTMPVQLNEQAYHYQKTSKTLKAFSWTSLGVGIATTAIGLQSVAASTETGKSVKWLLPTGISLISVSVPLFIFAHHYRSKAASLSFISRPVPDSRQRTFSSSISPDFGFKIIF